MRFLLSLSFLSFQWVWYCLPALVAWQLVACKVVNCEVCGVCRGPQRAWAQAATARHCRPHPPGRMRCNNICIKCCQLKASETMCQTEHETSDERSYTTLPAAGITHKVSVVAAVQGRPTIACKDCHMPLFWIDKTHECKFLNLVTWKCLVQWMYVYLACLQLLRFYRGCRLLTILTKENLTGLVRSGVWNSFQRCNELFWNVLHEQI